MEIGTKIAKLRKERGMSQKELAARLNVTDKAVSRWESGVGYPELDTVVLLAKEFNVSTDYLLLDSEERGFYESAPAKDRPKHYKLGAALCGVGVAVFFIAFAVCLSIFITHIVQYNLACANCADSAPVGISFPLSEANDKVIEFAAAQGRIGLTVDDADFIQWKNSLLGLYTFRDNMYWYNSYPLFNYGDYYLLIPICLCFSGFATCLFFLVRFVARLKREK